MDDPTNVLPFKKLKRKPAPEGSRKWERKLTKRFDRILPTLANVVTVLQNEEEWEGVFSFDLHAQRVRKEKKLPAGALDLPSPSIDPTPYLDDFDVTLVRLWIERRHGFTPSKSDTLEGITASARQSAQDPVRVYLDSLTPKPKVDLLSSWLTKFVAVQDSPYVRAVGRAWMISAVARIYEPACQVDHVLIIEGPQRGGKSSALRALCPNIEWFLSTTVDVGSKDAYQVLAGKWLVEFAELGSLSKAEESKIKNYITERVNTFRKSYGMLAEDNKRRCVFAGTVNPGSGSGYLKDATGGGRWWPVTSQSDIHHRLDIGKLEAARDQLWGEAVAAYKKGEPWHLIDPKLIEAAEEEQSDRQLIDPWEPAIRAYLTRPHIYEAGTDTGSILEEVCGVMMG